MIHSDCLCHGHVRKICVGEEADVARSIRREPLYWKRASKILSMVDSVCAGYGMNESKFADPDPSLYDGHIALNTD